MEMQIREKRHFRGTKNKLTKCLKRSIEYTDGYSGKRKAKRESSKNSLCCPLVYDRTTIMEISCYPLETAKNDYSHSQNR